MTSVLIADDHPLLRSGLEAVLVKAGLKVVGSVADGEEALQAIEQLNPDVLVVDVRMPRMNGVELVRKMRKDGDWRPAVALATEVDNDELASLVASGIDAVLYKTCSDDELIDTISNVAAGKSGLDRHILHRATSLIAKGVPTVAKDMLTGRQLHIARLVAKGLRNKEIADELGLKEGSVKAHVHNIYVKTGATSRIELANILATRHNG